MRWLACGFALMIVAVAGGAHPHAAPGVTSLTNSKVKYKTADKPYVTLKRNGVTAVIVNNAAVDDATLPNHRAGYSGIASLTHRKRGDNLFVPGIAGLNYEHIHDGTLKVDRERFEPRRHPLELRIVDRDTVELYQSPTPNWKLESCGRYRILADGVIEYTFECIPRAKTFDQGYIGLFWASYIHRPMDKAIWFRGRERDEAADKSRWIRALSPRHGVDSTHPPAGPLAKFKVDPKFSLTLVNHPSRFVYDSPWYYGVSHGMAYVQMFRSRDRIWLAQSPTGGGATNPAWDFQTFIPHVQVNGAYGFVMRMAYLPFENRAQVEKATAAHRRALNPVR